MATEPNWNIVFLLLNVVMWYTFINSATRDPGFLPCNSEEYDIALKKVRWYCFSLLFASFFHCMDYYCATGECHTKQVSMFCVEVLQRKCWM